MSCPEKSWGRGEFTLRAIPWSTVIVIIFQLACTTASGFAVMDGGSRLHHLCKPLPEYHAPYVRFNDGACDSHGRFFVGTIYSKDQGIPGKLWMYDPDTSECKVVDDGPFTVSYSTSLCGVKLIRIV